MDAGDILAISEGVLLASTWGWSFRVKRDWNGWREKSALFGLVCVSAAIIADLILSAIMHYRGDSDFAAVSFLITVVAGLLLGLAGLVLGIIGKGTPRVAAIVWSVFILASVAVTVFAMVSHAAAR